jgi:hypothetical protein
MSDRFLEQRININFCAKLENSASNTCEVLSEANGEEALKRSSVFSDINCSKRVARTWK